MKLLIPVLPMLMGFLLDAAIGDPYRLPHPVRLMGRFISFLEKKIRQSFRDLYKGGILLTVCVSLSSFIIPLAIILTAYRINAVLGIVTEGILCYYLYAARCLCRESSKVYSAIRKNDIEGGRKAVSMIVGRDTRMLDREGIIRAAVETVAENTSDGVTAPMLYMFLGGAPLGFFYKAVNTMDSMIGYKNEKYIDLGRAAARLDDILNFIPSRFTAWLMIIVCPLIKGDIKNAFRIWKRDRFCHASPNSAQTESACAGALNIRLAGDAYYFGRLCKKPYIGDDNRPVENEDIKKANKLMYLTSVLSLIIFSVIRIIILGGVIFDL